MTVEVPHSDRTKNQYRWLRQDGVRIDRGGPCHCCYNTSSCAAPCRKDPTRSVVMQREKSAVRFCHSSTRKWREEQALNNIARARAALQRSSWHAGGSDRVLSWAVANAEADSQTVANKRSDGMTFNLHTRSAQQYIQEPCASTFVAGRLRSVRSIRPSVWLSAWLALRFSQLHHSNPNLFIVTFPDHFRQRNHERNL